MKNEKTNLVEALGKVIIMREDNVKLLKGNDPSLVARQRQSSVTLALNAQLVGMVLRIHVDSLPQKSRKNILL